MGILQRSYPSAYPMSLNDVEMSEEKRLLINVKERVFALREKLGLNADPSTERISQDHDRIRVD